MTEAIYDSGYSAPSRFYADAKDRLGMTPSAWRDGGRGETIRYAMLDTPLGQMLVAAHLHDTPRTRFGWLSPGGGRSNRANGICPQT